MLDELRQVDTSVLDTLIDLKRERDTLNQRLARLSESGAQVTDQVLRRVRDDYESRLAGVEKRAAELKKKARESYRALKPLRDTAQQAFEAHRLDEEEIRLRHQLGEFSEEEYRSRVAKLGEGRKNAEGRQAEIAELVARFVGAFDSPEDLDPGSLGSGAIPVMASPPPSQDDEHTWVTPSDPPVPPPPQIPEAAAPTAEAESSDASVHDDSRPPEPPDTVSSSPVAPATDAPPRPQRPASAADGVSALLHALDGDIEPPDHPLEELTFIGRTPENQVRIYKPAVSRRHAQIGRTAAGWMLRDLSSENGTYVNGQRVTERLLADGDRVQFGTSRFIFKAG